MPEPWQALGNRSGAAHVCALVDYALVPVEHRLRAINTYTCVFHVVGDAPARLSLMRGQISRWSRALPGSGTTGYVG